MAESTRDPVLPVTVAITCVTPLTGVIEEYPLNGIPFLP
jgi:hypothetical protein